jgi:hypothetical protein
MQRFFIEVRYLSTLSPNSNLDDRSLLRVDLMVLAE